MNTEAITATRPSAATADETTVARIRTVIEQFRPALRLDGGDCELLKVEGNLVTVRMTGACVFCQYASATLSALQERLMDALGVPMRIAVVRGAAA